MFLNRGFDGFLVDNNIFKNFEDSLARPDGSFIANYSLIFAEAQANTSGNNYTITNNDFINIKHLNSIEAYRWKNVTIEQNSISGVHGRILVWNSGLDLPLQSVVIKDNDLDLSNGTDDYNTTGIGVYYAMADVNIIENEVDAANTCVTTIGVSDLELLDNELTNCAARGHYFDEPGAGVETSSATIVGNTFDTSPIGVENFSDDFKLDACDNTYINIGTERAENPGPFVRCEGDLLVEKQIDWKGNDSFEAEFEVCVSGPSYPDGDCQTISEVNGYTWTDLVPGQYTVAETELGNAWNEPQPTVVEVVKDTQVDQTLNNVYTPLQLTSMCSDDPSEVLRWRVRNHTDGPIEYSWEIVDGGAGAPSGSGTAPPGDSFFFSDRWNSNNVMVLFVNGVEQAKSRKASGYQQCAYDLSVTKFYDDDRDGVQDEGEATLEGWEFEVKQDGNVIDTVTTGEDGTVTLEDLPAGTYDVCELEQAGWQVSTDVCQTVTVSGEGGGGGDSSDNAVSFGNYELGKITIVKEANPSRENSPKAFNFDTSLQDDPFVLYGSPNAEDNSTTFENIALDEGHTFSEQNPGNWDLTSISCDDADDFSVVDGLLTVTLDDAAEHITCTFTNERRPQIKVTKYEDLNTDGDQDEGEPKLEGWDISIYLEVDGVWTQQQSTKTTPANGVVNFTSLEPGATYRVCEAPQADWGTTEPSSIIDFDGLICQEVTVQYGDNLPVSFGNYQLGTLTIIKDSNPTADWLDWEFDGGDLGTFSLNTGSNEAKTQLFEDVVAGEYTITETSLAERGNWYLANVDCGPDADKVETVLENGSATITMAESAESITCVFENVRRGQIEITKYDDVDRNGERDDDEAGLDGWQMFLYEQDESSDSGWTQIQPREVRTDSNGVANYTSLEMGSYLVCEEAREGWINSEPSDSFEYNGQICQEVAVSDASITEVVFGNYELAKLTVVKEATPAAEWLDWTFEGSGDIGSFTLDNDSGDEAHADRASFYLEPGDYTVDETNRPDNWDLVVTCDNGATYETEGNSDLAITLAGGDDVTCTFENKRQPQIEITKYEDGNSNGQRDDGEAGIEEWQMFLYIDDGNGGWSQIQPREVRTNGDGVANYTSLEAGVDHLVCEEAVEGWTNSEPGNAAGEIIDGQICQVVSGQALAYGEVVEVIFGNYEIETTLTIVKVVPTDLEHKFEFEAPFAPNGFSLTTNTDVATQTFNVAPGEYTISEKMDSFPDEHWELVSFSCDGNALNDEAFDNFDPTGTVTVQEGESVTCTFHNERSNLEEEVDGNDGQHKIYLPFVAK